MMDSKRILVLMSTYNGEKYLENCIKSILDQKGVSVDLLIRDDSSSDSTLQIINKCMSDRIKVYGGENKGPAGSFLDLIYKAPEYEYYAFADQDDIWKEDKLANAIELLAGENCPCICVSSYELIDKDGRIISNKISNRKYTFESALLGWMPLGCTQTFNSDLMRELKRYRPNHVQMHDHWISLVCFAVGGKYVYDEEIGIQYRQHGENVIGHQKSVFSRLKGYISDCRKGECSRLQQAMEVYNGYAEQMNEKTLENITMLIGYKGNLKNKLQLLINKDFRHYGRNSLLFLCSVLIERF